MKVLRRITGETLFDRERSQAIRESCNIPQIGQWVSLLEPQTFTTEGQRVHTCASGTPGHAMSSGMQQSIRSKVIRRRGLCLRQPWRERDSRDIVARSDSCAFRLLLTSVNPHPLTYWRQTPFHLYLSLTFGKRIKGNGGSVGAWRCARLVSRDCFVMLLDHRLALIAEVHEG
ncbi:hypothetical protein ANN_06235 [Periplaneta americana]|uniref:Per a allergen n=1 Tax=Periplaneta americana TaxID=6978 RepID=A0ABQ8TDV6_PERAM|nr:hypothetical protein ANN_06235 [Periplaneta americana]